MLNFKGWFESFPNISLMGKVQYKAKQSYTATTDHSSQESLHYICMQVQLGFAMNMNNKAVVSAAVSINSVLRMVGV